MATLTSNKKKRKGQTIVEVMIAFTILAVVLSSTFILMIRAVNLVLTAQSRTEAIEIAQRGLSEGVLLLQGSCGINTAANLSAIQTKNIAGSVPKTLVVSKTDHPGLPDSLASDDFILLTATVTWDDKGAPDQSVALSQLVRVNK